MTDASKRPNPSGAAPAKGAARASAGEPARTGNFIRTAIDADLAAGKWAVRRWSGAPDVAAAHRQGAPDPARIRTRFPPEPNGYLHVGHAKSICLNFGLARDYAGHCHMRFDDTNPVKEDQEYVDSILDSVRWLGFDWRHGSEENLYYASDYFEHLYTFAEWLVQSGHAYVDSQSPEEMRARRGTLTEPGQDSPYRTRSADESLQLLREMRAGKHPEGSHVLRARIDMASPNINLRDPALYRIRFAEHHRTGDAWCIYPMYDYAHPLSDALENITHSICTLEFEDHRPFYDWVLERVAEGGFFDRPLPVQIEFARGNVTYVITSKRRLQQLVRDGHVDGWDDPRMPTIVGLRRRGYTPESIQLFWERIGVARADSWIDYATLEAALRDDLEAKAPRSMAVLDPVRLVIDNFPADGAETLSVPAHPQRPELGTRSIGFGRELWIDAEDFREDPPKGYHRLYPGNMVRLKYAFVVRCTSVEEDADGRIVAVHAEYMPDSRSGTPGADTYKVKGAITWLPVAGSVQAEVRLYDRLFTDPHPDAGGKDFLQALNPQSRRIVQAYVEASAAGAAPDTRFQFERHGYFVTDRVDHRADRPVFNRAVSLKDSFTPKT